MSRPRTSHLRTSRLRKIHRRMNLHLKIRLMTPRMKRVRASMGCCHRVAA
jgi:hypothetical protein